MSAKGRVCPILSAAARPDLSSPNKLPIIRCLETDCALFIGTEQTPDGTVTDGECAYVMGPLLLNRLERHLDRIDDTMASALVRLSGEVH